MVHTHTPTHTHTNTYTHTEPEIILSSQYRLDPKVGAEVALDENKYQGTNAQKVCALCEGCVYQHQSRVCASRECACAHDSYHKQGTNVQKVRPAPPLYGYHDQGAARCS